ncbi:MAG: 2-C-methyl-D-erythritol 4-phosphate cytidylyltransferase [Lachnospiraceae bacterium]|nr:2-C-methyl-D-erythritol 4-phosphate cytidylyltransferase [Lachnospiraceae bacterium]
MKEQVSAIVLAAGQGKRMNSQVQKQFMLLQNKPVLYYSLKCFQECEEIQRIILVTGENEIEYCKKDIVDAYGFDKVTNVVAGGKERYDSVEQGLHCIEDGIVLIHDGARPFVTRDMILRSIEATRESGACTVGMPVKDTIKVVNEEGYGIQTPDRKTLWQIQTPQTFRVPVIKEAYVKMRSAEAVTITDDTMLVEYFSSIRAKVIEGDYCNIKITTPEDMVLAEAFLRQKQG